MTPPRPLVTLTALLSLVALANLWIYARFTVDDAFITWRYGLNLIRHGIWAYNPDGFDLTQAYTNPVFAVLSILPAALGFDMVLAFKLLSLAVLILLGTLLLREAGDRVRMGFVLALLMAVPATVAHAFSGLETMVYGGALGLFFILQEQRRWRGALACVALLVLTRPEAWLLYPLYPALLIAARAERRVIVVQTLLLALLAGAYFGFHLWWFGEAMPNTYFIKAGDGFSLAQAAGILPYVLPALLVLAFGNRRTGAALVIYFGAVGYSYAGSDLLMNYFQRFPFQILLPMALYLGWVLSRMGGARANWALLGLTGYIAAFGWHTARLGDHLVYANYYPRLLDSHVRLGRALHDLGREGVVSGFALGDAGAAAYHSDLRALDTYGLTSHRIAREGVSADVLRAYAPDVLAFFATEDGIRDQPAQHAAMQAYAGAEGFTEQCEVYWARQYTMRLFTRAEIPALQEVCATSRTLNAADEVTYALTQLRRPPWAYWHE
ncbi:hypothetical protein JI664_06235 [Rhodobacter sp. NTK016B]|uniref:hypothetical protein n=2 Tax=Bacteria TaxID=2 RepID=UPI001A8D7870|nr:hypothetical protein [Rhodobacter sp. NTK016B]MBN8291553.1 hypothetical protein [Rhodobacter sp. NTK016B]